MTSPAIKSLTTVQEQVLTVIQRVEDQVVGVLEPVAKVVEGFLPALPRLPLADQVPRAEEIVEVSFDVLGKLVANERAFAQRLLQALQLTKVKPAGEPGAVSLKAQLEAETS